jgi:hypothetical protein
MSEDDWVDEEAFYAPPPGKEGVYFSYAGGYEEVCHSIMEQVSGKL